MRPVFFIAAGTAGFAVDAGTTACLMILSVSPLLARIVGMMVAIQVTWLLNRHLTFGRAEQGTSYHGAKFHILIENVRYVIVGVAAGGINFGVFATILSVWPHAIVCVAVAAGSLAAMVTSYLGFSTFVFVPPRSKD